MTLTIFLKTLLAGAFCAAVTAAAACPTGKPVTIEWNDGQYPGLVLEGPDAQGNCLVSYDNYDASWDEWVAPARLSVAAGAPPAPPAALCPTGTALEIEWNGEYWAGVILDGPNAAGQCYVTYDGWDASWNEWVTPDRLRPVAIAGVPGCPIGVPLEIEWNGSWWDGSVLQGPNLQGHCLVTYEGWDASWNEWVAPERLRTN